MASNICIECGKEMDESTHNYGTDLFFCCLDCYTLATMDDEINEDHLNKDCY